jgi:hypothetical protein
VDARPIDVAAEPLAELVRIAPITLLARAMGLEPHLARIDHDRHEPERRELARDEERDGALSSATGVPAGQCTRNVANPSGVVGTLPRATILPCASCTSNTDALLCTSTPA